MARRRSLFAIVAVLAVVVVGGMAALMLSGHGGRAVTTTGSSPSGQAATTGSSPSGQAATTGSSPSGQAATRKICQEDNAPASGGTYIVQNDEFGSSAPECVTTDSNTDFTVANSSIDLGTNGPPGGYTSIYQGCHWGKCSAGGLTSRPIQVSNLTAGQVTTSWSTAQPGGNNTYDVSYDIWFNRAPTTSGQPDCTELMVWLNHDGSIQPIGSQIAGNVSVGGRSYAIWEGSQPWGDTITYDMTTGTTLVSGLDVGTLAQNAVKLGYLSRSCYLIDIEAGFELWRGGAGLATKSFSVTIAGRRGAGAPQITPSRASS